MDEITEEPAALTERVAALDIGKASLTACIRVPHEDKPGARRQEVRTYATLTPALLELRDWLVCQGVTLVVIFVRTQRVPKDCVAIGRRRIVVLDFRYGALGFVAIPVVSCDADHVGGHSGRRPLACWTAWTTRLRLASSSPVRASRRSTG